MRKIIITLLSTIICIAIYAQVDGDKMGMISLNPFIPEEENLDEQTSVALLNKLQQIATISGMTGEGFDNRFIITAHLQEQEKSNTATTPSKTAVRLAATIYIGDGIDGTLFSSYTKEVKGIGDTESHAYLSAIRKLQVRDAQLQEAVEKGKQRIIQYYDQIAPQIISSAKAAAKGGKYEEAMSMLFAIPMVNDQYNTAQSLIAEYAEVSHERNNQIIVSNARAAWSASPDEKGAADAKEILSQLVAPSAKVIGQTKALSTEIATRLKAVDDREWNLIVQQENNAHKQEMSRIQSEKEQNLATINAAASVARAYYNSQPRVVYHVRSWWY